MNVYAEGADNSTEETQQSVQSSVYEENTEEAPDTLQNQNTVKEEEPVKVQEDSDEKDEPETEEPAWKAGWNLREDHWYYCKEEGKLYLGWIKLKSKWYYLDGENAGIMACNEVKRSAISIMYLMPMA